MYYLLYLNNSAWAYEAESKFEETKASSRAFIRKQTAKRGNKKTKL